MMRSTSVSGATLRVMRRARCFLWVGLGLALMAGASPAWAGSLPGWSYKTPVTITNGTITAITDYQVRIDLDTSNFTFSQANSDGSDIRFTTQDGVTLLPYWMESWVAGTSATLWVRVSAIPANGSTTIYLYSGNSSATSASSGSTTFSFFDGFDGTWTAWTKEVGPGTFVQSADQARRGTGSGKLVTDAASGSTVFSPPTANSLPGSGFVQEWDFYDDLDATAFKMVRATQSNTGGNSIGLGVWTGSSTGNYAYHTMGYSYTATSAARSVGWHKMGISFAAGGAVAFSIDGTQVGTLSGLSLTPNRITVEGIPDGPTTYYVDDFRVRKHVATAPTVAVGVGGQSGPDVAVTIADSPDPVTVGQQLTYTLTVNNYGDQDATNVTVTDVLPAGVTYVSATSSQGGCYGTSTVTASLGTVLSGASATVTIVVTTTVEGSPSDNASVTCDGTDLNTGNNSATATTTVGNPVVLIVNSVDTEAFNNHPTGTQHVAFDLSNYIPATTTFIGPLMSSSTRNANLDSYGTPFKMTWFMEMDNFINNGIYGDGSSMDYLTLYSTFKSNYGTQLAAWGDELAYHHHFMTWGGASWSPMTDGSALGTTYDEHNNALDRMVLDAGFFPTDFRSGWLWEANQLQAWEEQWLLGDFGYGSSYNSYHPSATDYTQPGSMNHWITGSDGSGPSSANLDAAFTKAASTGKPVVYNWYCHDREPMSSYVASVQSLATAASASHGVPFRYVTGKEAMQVLMKSTDVTPPVLAVTGGGGTFNITSNEAVWNNKPYVAARYIAADGLKYEHDAAVLAGTNDWTVTLPDQRTITTVIAGAKYSPVGVTASSAKPGNPASYAIDGNESTYWDSYELPQWIYVDIGSVQPVPRLTVHFYDGDARTYTYSIDASSDGSTWTEIVSSRTVHGLATHDFGTPVNLRYARVNVTAQSINNFAHIFEICLYQTLPGSTSVTAYLQQVAVGAGDLAGNTSVGTTVVRALADVALSMTATPVPMPLGEDLTYHLTVTNNGPSAASGIQVTDVLPAGATYVSAASSQGTCSGTSTVVADLGELASGASATVTIVVHPTAEATYVNSASATSSSADMKQTNNSASVSTTVVLSPADVALAMTAPASVKIGNDLAYSLTVTNHGPYAASGIQMTDVLPAGATYVSATASQGSCSGTSTVVASLGALASGASATVAIVVHPTAEGTYANTANVTSSSATSDPDLANNSASVSTTVGNPVVYVVYAVDTEANNNHPMGSLHTTFDVSQYQRPTSGCAGFMADYSADGNSWTSYGGSTMFNFKVTAYGGTDPATSYTCGSSNAYGLDDYARAVQFTVPSDGDYDVGVQLSVTGSPPATNLYVVPDLGGVPDVAHAISTYTATVGGFTSGSYVVIGSNLTLEAGVNYWWVAARQASGDDANQFAVYQGSGAAGGSTTWSQIMDGPFRNTTRDSDGRSYRMTWYMEMDNFINNGLYADGTPMNFLTLYQEMMKNWSTEVHGYGDEVAYHHHFMYWDGSSWQQGGHEHATDGQYEEHNNALNHMVLDANFFPSDFRAGWLNNSNQLQEWVERWLLSDDGGGGWATAWHPYHPSATDYTQVGSMSHWIMNAPGGSSQDGVNSAFAQATAENGPVVYGLYMHDRDGMRGVVAATQGYLQIAAAANPSVSFKYVTAREAIQAIAGTTDITSPTLAITPAGASTFTITSSEALLGNGPYVAAEYGSGSSAVYVHVSASPSGTNTWTASVPATNGELPVQLVGAGALDLAGNGATARLNLAVTVGVPVAGLVCTPATSGNDASGLTKTVVTWSGGGGGSGGVKVYRKGWGDYPLYPEPSRSDWPPEAPASAAAAEAAGWTLTSVTASGETDQPLTRDYWSYVAFSTDGLGHSSAASGVTPGMLNYLLGDVTGEIGPGTGNNEVDGLDVSLLGDNYGFSGSQITPANDYLDVGPTVGYSTAGRPLPDGVIEFEDLIIFALNFGAGGGGGGGALVAGRQPATAATGDDGLALEVPELPAVGGEFAVVVRATAGGGLHALKLELGYDRTVVEMAGVEAGELLGRQGAPAVALTPKPGRVDVALLGPGTGLTGSGELVRVRFRVKGSGAAGLRLASAEGRDGANRKVTLGGGVATVPTLPTAMSFALPAPNPFSHSTTLSFALAHGGAVELGVYGVDGRKVATLVREVREPGLYQVSWDGRDGSGQPVRPGMYYAQLATPEGRFTRRLVLMR
jgi:uncharacterized repeat protein (TIGR01451 family)